MSTFPRTKVGGLSLSRMIVGTNWFLGFSHCTPSKDRLIKEVAGERKQMADILEVFFKAGVDTVIGLIDREPLADAIKDAEDRTGIKAIIVSTPFFPVHRETPVHGFDPGLDVETYISIYNSMGFLQPIEVDWTAGIIRGAKKPVMTIKPMAAGQIRPFQALNFVWNTIRHQDMVTVGTMTPDEAKELIDLSLSILEQSGNGLKLQETRSKASVKKGN